MLAPRPREREDGAMARRRAVVAVTLAVALFALSSANAYAMSTSRADSIALRVLRPQAQSGRVVLFGLPAAVGAGHAVFDLAPPNALRFTRRVPLLRHRTWLFWEDLAYDAKFEHPSRIVLIDDRSGRVVSNRTSQWWPVIDGRSAPFVAAGGYASPRYIIFSNVPGPTTGMATRTGVRAVAADVAPVAAPRGSLAGECIITVGHNADSKVAGDFAGLDALTTSLTAAGTGLQTFDGDKASSPIENSAANGNTLRTLVNNVVANKNCKDILIYLDGHGNKTGVASVFTGTSYHAVGSVHSGLQSYSGTTGRITTDDIKAVLAAHRNIGFKLKVDACYSGRFVLDLPKSENPNLVILETSSKATETSLFSIPTITDANGHEVKSLTNNPGNAVIQVPDPKHPGRTIAEYDEPHGRSEFTNGNLTALETFFTTPALVATAQSQGGSLLARALEYGSAHSDEQDFAAQQGLTHPLVEDNVTATGPGGPPAAFACTVTATGATTYMGTAYDAGVNGQCNNTFDRFSVTVPAGYSISDYFAKSYACTLYDQDGNVIENGATLKPGQRVARVVCDRKPGYTDFYVYLHVTPPLAPGTVLTIDVVQAGTDYQYTPTV